MMSRDAERPTEPPTPRRRAEARAHGHVAVSRDLGAAAVLAAIFALLAAFGPAALARLVGAFAAAMSRAPAGSEADAPAALRSGLELVMALLGPALGAAFLAALLLG